MTDPNKTTRPSEVSDGLNAVQDAEQTAARSERAPWRDFPPLIRNGTLAEMQSAESYRAAKAGNGKAALALVQSLLTKQTVDAVKEMVGDKTPLIVGIRAEESAGRNRIPAMMAEVLAEHTGWQTDRSLYQVSYAGRTGRDSSYRLAFPAIFGGNVQSGRDYLIVDDNSTMGGTIAGLRGYIENRGGHVLGAVVMSARATGLNIVPTQKQLDEIQRKHGDAPNDYWLQTFGYGIDQLTRGEAGAIRSSPTFDAIRDRIAQARLRELSRVGKRGTAQESHETTRPQHGAERPKVTQGVKPSGSPTQAAAQDAAAFSLSGGTPRPVQEQMMSKAQQLQQTAVDYVLRQKADFMEGGLDFRNMDTAVAAQYGQALAHRTMTGTLSDMLKQNAQAGRTIDARHYFMMQDIKQFEQAGILVSEPNSRNGWDYRFSETGRALTLTLLNHPIRTEKTHQAERPSETRPQAPDPAERLDAAKAQYRARTASMSELEQRWQAMLERSMENLIKGLSPQTQMLARINFYENQIRQPQPERSANQHELKFDR